MRAWVLIAILFVPALFYAGSVVADSNSNSPTVLAARARDLVAKGDYRDAISLLKTAIASHEDAIELRWLLARAYLLDENDFWALRTLTMLAEISPESCEPYLWMAWISLQQGALDEAKDNLLDAKCLFGSPSETRRMLLFAMLEQHSGEHDMAQAHLVAARKADKIYKEDRVLLDRLTATLDPGFIPPVSAKMELTVGATSNARASSPSDAASSGADVASPLGQFNLWLRFVMPSGKWVRPTMEGEARLSGYTANSARDLNYAMNSLRPGILIGNNTPTVLLAYRFETFLLAGGDRYNNGPLWFYEAHRAEVEASLLDALSLFGGVGRRNFRENGRSRIEADAGVGGSFLPSPKLRLLGALTARLHNADNGAYDLRGGTLLSSMEARLPKSWSLRVGALIGIDMYPHSAGYFDPMSPDARRRDALLRLSTSGFSPPVAGFKFGLTYEYAERVSSIASYSYRDHRILVKVSWRFATNPWGPKASSPKGHVSLDHSASPSEFDERIQDLLRQDEAAQRSSSCVE